MKHFYSLLTCCLILFPLLFSAQSTAQNVGIGAAKPDVKLDINGQMTVRGGELYLENSDNSGMQLQADAGNGYIKLLDGSAALGSLHGKIGIDNSYSNARSNLNTLGGQSLAVQDHGFFGGNLGVGATDPSFGSAEGGKIVSEEAHNFSSGPTPFEEHAHLTLYNDITNTTGSRSVLLFHTESDGASSRRSAIVSGGTGGSGTGFIDFYGDVGNETVNDQADVRIASDGNVGIGTTSPSKPLEVHGDIQLKGSSPDIRGADEYWFRDEDNSGGKFRWVKLNDSRLQLDHSTNFGMDFIQVDHASEKLTSNANLRFTKYANGYLKVNSTGHVSSVGTIPSGSISEDDPTWDGSNTTVNDINRPGNVGIGENSPTAALEINNGSYTQLRIENDSAGKETGIRLRARSSGDSHFFHADIAAKSTANSSNVGYLGFKVPFNNTAGSGYDLAVTSAGNTGIGTTNPSEKLHVNGDKIYLETSAGNLTLGPDGGGSNKISSNGWLINESGSNKGITFRQDGSEKMRVDNSGNIGIGTTNPSDILHVDGKGGGEGITISEDAAHLRLKSTDDNGREFHLISSPDEWTNGPNFQIQDETANEARFVINPDGNVGVGTSGPNGKLNINRSSSASYPASQLFFSIDGNTGSGTYSMGIDPSDNDKLKIGSSWNAASGTHLTITKNGRLGLGTSSPSRKMEVNGDIKLSGSSPDIRDADEYWFQDEEGSGGNYRWVKLSDARLQLDHSNSFGTDFISVDHNANTLTSDVNVGVGTSNPNGRRLNVQAGSDQRAAHIEANWDGQTGHARSLVVKNNGHTSGAAKYKGIQVASKAPANSSGYTSGRAIGVLAKAGGRNLNTGVHGQLKGGSDYSNTTGTAILGEDKDASGFSVSDLTSNRYAGYFVGDVKITGSTIGFSDKRLKKNIREVESSLDRLMQIGAYSFEYKESKNQGLTDGKQYGFIAQEVEKIAPSMVQQSGKDGYKSLRHHQMTPLVVDAVKEQQKQHLSQEKKIESLQSENDSLKNQIEDLKEAVHKLQERHNQDNIQAKQ